MKKIFLFVFMFCLLLIPIRSFANTDEGNQMYSVMNLEETLSAEKIEPNFSNYKETDDQVIIYLFRGNGCSYCHAFLQYLNSIVEEYGKYFKLASYEVWSNPNNSLLMEEVTELLDQPARGVPYIIIGDQVFTGYAEVYNDSIKDAIMNLYESEERYDILKEMEKLKKKEKIDKFFNGNIFDIILITCFVLIGNISILIYIHHKNKIINKRLVLLEQKIKISNDIKEKKIEVSKKNKN